MLSVKIVVAVDSYKGSADAYDIAEYIEKGILKTAPDTEVIKLPIADGGEGTVAILNKTIGGQLRRKVVTGPSCRPVEGVYAILPDGTAVIEIASASGLMHVSPDRLNPLTATSYGTGELIRHAINDGCRNFLIGVGGSATNDGGAGLVQALGVSLLDCDGNELESGGGALNKLVHIDTKRMDSRIKDCRFIIASDISNPLCGSTGASYVFGPQKGATQKMVEILDGNLSHYINVVENFLHKEIRNVPGAGAGGGTSASLIGFCDAVIESGIDTILNAIGFESHINDADLVVTGEGQMDLQSLAGKAPIGVAKRVKAYKDIPVVAIVGSVAANIVIETLYNNGIDSLVSAVNRVMPLSEAMEKSGELVTNAAEQMMNLIKIGMRI